MRKIGSKTPTVRQLYIAYRLLLQIENSVEDFDPEKAEQRFAILYMTIQTEGAKQYLQIDIMADTQAARIPVPETRLLQLANFTRWLFGTTSADPIVTDTRKVSQFGTILQSEEAIQYMERSQSPSLMLLCESQVVTNRRLLDISRMLPIILSWHYPAHTFSRARRSFRKRYIGWVRMLFSSWSSFPKSSEIWGRINRHASYAYTGFCKIRPRT